MTLITGKSVRELDNGITFHRIVKSADNLSTFKQLKTGWDRLVDAAIVYLLREQNSDVLQLTY